MTYLRKLVMRLLVITVIVFLCQSVCISQTLINKSLIGQVVFQKDNQDWIATVSQKNSIIVTFKMMFEVLPKDNLPPSSRYLVSYRSNYIEFLNLKTRQKFVFKLDDGAVPKADENKNQWLIIGLSRTN